MSLTVTQRPYQSILGSESRWNAVGNPILYKMQRKDFSFTQINNNGGFVQLQFNGVDITGSFSNGATLYVQSDNGVYDASTTQSAEAFSGGNTLITTAIVYTSAATTGFCNNDTLRPLYRVNIDVYNTDNTLLNTASFGYSPTSKGALTIDVSPILRANMTPDNNSDITGSTKVFNEPTVYEGFYIKYTEVWTGSANSATNDFNNKFVAIFGAMQIPSTYGGNIYEYLTQSDMKIADVTIPTASVLTGNSVPYTVVAAPGAGYILIPVKFFIFLDYNSVAYATNTTFRFEINGVAVSATDTGVLPGTADRYVTMEPVDYATTTDLTNQAIKFEVQTGDPTAGNSNIRVVTLYSVRQLA